MIELLERSPLTILDETGLPREGIEGKVDAKFKIGLPLLAELPASSVKVEAKGKITDGRVKQFLGAYQVQGASFDLDISEKAAGANGQMLINGVLAKLSWQRIFDAPLDKQPPLRLTATLDNTDRSQLGLDINHIVQGVVPIELTVGRGASDEQTVRLHADLTNADSPLIGIAWRKPPGRTATLQCDIAKGKTHKTELQNFKVAGDDIAIEGWAAIDNENRLREFYFPDFSLNVITRMEVQGTLDKNDIWKVKARGPHVRRARLLPLAVLPRPARRERAEAEEPARGHRSRRRDRHRHRPFGGVAARRQAEARQARRQADGARRARHARRQQQADRHRAAPGSGPAAQAACRFNRRRSGIQADRLLSQHSGRPRAPRGQPRGQGRSREDRHPVGR